MLSDLENIIQINNLNPNFTISSISLACVAENKPVRLCLGNDSKISVMLK